jgi:hypothetical protein
VKGLAGRAGLFQRRSAFDATQQLLGLAIKTNAGVAANDFRGRLERATRLVAIIDNEVNRG